jgi:uncharacterized protein
LKLQAERMEGSNAISRHGPGGVAVNGVEHTQSVVVRWTGEVLNWDVGSFDELTAAHFEFLAALKPELVIFGSGARLRFAKPALLKPLFDARIGIETMDSAAACRTYNVLLAESRTVIAALIFETLPSPSS